MNDKLKPSPIPILSVYRIGSQIQVQLGPTIPDQTVCMMEVAGALISMARDNVVQEHKEQRTIAVAPPGMRVLRSD